MTHLIEHLRQLALGDGALTSDGELLGRYIDDRDEVALAALIRRHGPMVWGVCRRLLAHHDAEDAFQATFLVLVRKARSITPRSMVANWLYGVAHQTALHARRTASRRQTREVPMDPLPEVATVPSDREMNLHPVIYEELSRLPEIYRAVIVLCDLECRTRKDAACHLGVPEGTVAGRLARARELLARRLSSRGIVVSSATLGALLTESVVAADVTGSLIPSTIAAISAHAVKPTSATLTEGVLRVMFLTKMKSVMITMMIMGFMVMGATMVPYHTASAQNEAPKKPPVSFPVVVPPKPAEKAAEPSRKMKMRVTAKEGRSRIQIVVGDRKYTAEADEVEYDEESGSLFLKGKGVLITEVGKEPATVLNGEAILTYPDPNKFAEMDRAVGRP